MSNGLQRRRGGARATARASGGVQSVDRAVSVLEILAREGSAGVSEVAAEIGVHKSTAFRLLAALEERDLVEQNSERGKYQLGFGVLRLASAIPARLDLVRQARPVLDELAQRFDETINLAVLRENYSVHVQQALGSAAVASQNWVGQLTPLHATSSGKILLAYMSDEQVDQILDAAGLKAFTEHTVTSRKVLVHSWPQVREAGFATALRGARDRPERRRRPGARPHRRGGRRAERVRPGLPLRRGKDRRRRRRPQAAGDASAIAWAGSASGPAASTAGNPPHDGRVPADLLFCAGMPLDRT